MIVLVLIVLFLLTMQIHTRVGAAHLFMSTRAAAASQLEIAHEDPHHLHTDDSLAQPTTHHQHASPDVKASPTMPIPPAAKQVQGSTNNSNSIPHVSHDGEPYINHSQKLEKLKQQKKAQKLKIELLKTRQAELTLSDQINTLQIEILEEQVPPVVPHQHVLGLDLIVCFT